MSADTDLLAALPRQRVRSRTRLSVTLLLVFAAVLAWGVAASLFVVDVTEYAVVTRFGHVIRVIDSPGLYVTMPLDRVQRLERRLLVTATPPAEYLTSDKKNVVAQALMAWGITDPVRFLSTLRTPSSADERLSDTAVGELGAVLGQDPFAALVSAAPDPVTYKRPDEELRDRMASIAKTAFGIDVSEVSLRRIALTEQNRQSVFARMAAERGRIAMRFRSEGELEAKKIIAAADRTVVEITAQAYAEAQLLRAQGDAGAARIYADAARRDPTFYRFLRTLQADEKILGHGGATLVLPAGSEALGLSGNAPAPGGTGQPSPHGPGDLVAREPPPAALDLLLGQSRGQGAGRP